MRNIILVHLESLNDLIFNMNEGLFSNLNAIKKDSYYYKNYYSSATSTLMVMTDIAFGRDDIFDSSTHLEDIYSLKPASQTIFDYFHEQGYRVYIALCGWEDADKPEETVQVLCKNATCILTDSLKELDDLFKEELENLEQPYLLYIIDNVSHIAYALDRITQKETTIQQRFYERYSQLDMSVGRFLEMVRNSSKRNDTSMIFYGDHGDELWGHGLHGGYTHAIEPYMTMIKTPLFVWNGKEKGICEDLLNSCDIGKIMKQESRLDIEKKESKDVLFSRNLFINQDNNIKKFNKSFSVTDGKYLLIVSANGLEMYNNVIDYTCNNNLLDFFVLHKDGEIVYDNNFDIIRTHHYVKNMCMAEQENIIAAFKNLFDSLEEYVTTKYKSCGKNIDVRLDKINANNTKKIKVRFKLNLFGS